MRIKLTLARGSGPSDDIVVTADAAATIAEVAQAIDRADPRRTSDATSAGPLTLRATLPGSDEPLILPPDAAIGEAWIGSGATVSLVDAGVYYLPTGTGQRPAVVVVRVVNGPEAGRSVEFPSGTVLIGRDPACDLVLADPLVSKRHVRLEVDAVTELVDLGSANGVVVDGGIVSRLRVTDQVTVTLGDTDLEIEVIGSSARTGAAPTAGPVFFNRSPRVEPRYPGEPVEGPTVPKDVSLPPFPFLAMIAPLVMGSVLFAITHNAQSLLFVALSPLLMVGNFVTQRTQTTRKRKTEIARFEGQLSRLTEHMAGERERELAARLREAPSSGQVLDEAHRRGPMMWTRRPEHWSFLNVRLGLGEMRSRNVITEQSRAESLPDFQERFDRVADENRTLRDVPVVDNLHESGAIGVAAPGDTAVGVVNALLVQLTGLHSPAEVVIGAITSPSWSTRFDWLKWMPHANSPHSPIGAGMLADSASSGSQLISAIEELVQARLADARTAEEQRRGATTDQALAIERGANVGTEETTARGTRSPVPSIVLLVTDDAPVDRARLVQLAESAADAGVFPIWIAERVADLPAVCRTYLDLTGEVPTAGLVRLGDQIEGLEVEQVSTADALDFARRMSPVIDAGAMVADSSDLPRAVSLVTLLGHDLVESSDAVIDRWRQNESIHDRARGSAPKKRRQPGKLRAIVGSAGVDPMHLDLRTQGPHALVGGTTGAGKSEFLQAWVLGMAAEYSPDRVTFLFVDYKGGSAFADCVSLPHCVGLVTDLSPHLVRRALTSLRAELHHREHLLNRKKAKDLLELERRGDPESPPALVLVIDEFAALAGEVPEFVDGVVDVAQRGRSLGIHLIMATQRPAGVIKDNLRANTNMRVALRMADESDSQDVVGVKDAGGFDPALPGRGLAKTGPGRLTMFQSGYAGGWTSRDPERADVTVAELRFGGEVRWEEPRGDAQEEERELGPTDQQRLVAKMIAAARAASIPPPRRPWLDQLAPVYDLAKLRQRTDAELLLGVADIPERQQQLPCFFYPDVDGNVAIFGTGGSGKSAALRTVAAASAITPRGGPVQVYALDFGSGSLRMLDALPHVGAVIPGEEAERVIRLFRMLKAELEERSQLFSIANASNITEYRSLSADTGRPRILLLIDGFPNFREDFEIPAGRSPWYDVFRDILSEGRRLGIHVVLTADRPGAVPASIASMIGRRVVLRLADDSYGMLEVPSDILSAASPAGRAIIDGAEAQIAVLGGSTQVAEQSAALAQLGEAMRRAGVTQAPGIGSLPIEYTAGELPTAVAGQPVLGLSDIDLGPAPFDPTGVVLLAGPPASGRTSALHWLAQSVVRSDPEARLYYLGNSRSPLVTALNWTESATTADQVAALAKDLAAAMADDDTEGRIAVFIESIGDFLQSSADGAIVELAKTAKRSDHLVVAEAEMSAWGSSWPLMAEFKNGRRGLLLQPETVDGDILLKTQLPRINRGEFPPGRGMYIAKGKATRVQLPLPG